MTEAATITASPSCPKAHFRSRKDADKEEFDKSNIFNHVSDQRVYLIYSFIAII